MTDLLGLAGKRALVTGGTRGIGAAISATLARAGADVVLGYRDDDASALALLATILGSGGKARLAKRNIAHPDEARALVEEAAGDEGLDVLVHSAVIGSFKPALDVRANQWDLTMSVGPRALLLLSQEAARRMEGRAGRIVALSSLGGSRVVPSYGAIGASKAATESLVRSLAAELGPKGITVNAVSAGLVGTSSVRLHPAYAELERESVARTPLGRLGTPDDVARVVLFLASPLSAWITGQVLVADGGLSLGI